MTTPVSTEVLLVSNVSSPLAGEINMPLAPRWEPRPGHYLDMTIRRVDFTNYFRHNLINGARSLQMHVHYQALQGSTDEFSYTINLFIQFPITRMTHEEIAQYITDEIDALYGEIESIHLSKCWSEKSEVTATGAESGSRVSITMADHNYGSVKSITSLQLPRPIVTLDEVLKLNFKLGITTRTVASRVERLNGAAKWPAMYIETISFSLDGGLPEKIGLVDPDLLDSANRMVFNVYPQKPLSYFAVWEDYLAQIRDHDATEHATTNTPATVPQHFPNIIMMSPKLLLIESLMVQPPRYTMTGFSSDQPRRAPLVSIPFPDDTLTGRVQLFAPQPITHWRLPGALDKLDFRFYLDGKEIIEGGFEVVLELVIREMPEQESLNAPTFHAHTHGSVAPPIVDFEGLRNARRGHHYEHPDSYDSRTKRPRTIPETW